MRDEGSENAGGIVNRGIADGENLSSQEILVLRRGSGNVDAVVKPIERKRQQPEWSGVGPGHVGVRILDCGHNGLQTGADFRV